MDVPHARNNSTNAPRSNINGNMNVDLPTLPASSSAVASVAVKQDHNAVATAATVAASS